MKKVLIAVFSLILLVSCTEFKSKITQDKISYQEFEANTESIKPKLMFRGDEQNIYNDPKLYLNNNKISFWHDQSQKIKYFSPMSLSTLQIKCVSGKSDCKIIGVLEKKDSIPDGFKIMGECHEKGFAVEEDGWCLVVEPKLPMDVISNLKNTIMPLFYESAKNLYTVIAVGDENDLVYRNYTVYENDKELFTHKMIYGADSVFANQYTIGANPVFVFYDFKGEYHENAAITFRNIFYKGEIMNEKYQVEESEALFPYKDRLGFIATKNKQKYIFFDGKKVSNDFDYIYPVEIYENGTLFFMGKRGEKYFFAEVNLNGF
jgi:hypothetical protein